LSSLDWGKFDSLPGSKAQNFENLCRALARIHFGQFGQFAALKNQPGVEFHLNLKTPCAALGGSGRWYGWQCKMHERTVAGDLKAASKADIVDSLSKAEQHLPALTDWVLWTPYTLSKSDQLWFSSLSTKFTLHQWTDLEVDTYLNGPGLMLRKTYFGELVVTPNELAERHEEAIQPIRDRWLQPVHQEVDAERTLRRMLGEPQSWDEMITVGRRLQDSAPLFSSSLLAPPPQMAASLEAFQHAVQSFADTLLNLGTLLVDGDLDAIQQRLDERENLIDSKVCAVPR